MTGDLCFFFLLFQNDWFVFEIIPRSQVDPSLSFYISQCHNHSSPLITSFFLDVHVLHVHLKLSVISRRAQNEVSIKRNSSTFRTRFRKPDLECSSSLHRKSRWPGTPANFVTLRWHRTCVPPVLMEWNPEQTAGDSSEDSHWNFHQECRVTTNDANWQRMLTSQGNDHSVLNNDKTFVFIWKSTTCELGVRRLAERKQIGWKILK